MYKSFRILSVFLLMAALFCGCASSSKVIADHERYDVLEKNGTYSLCIDTEIRSKAESGASNSGAAISPTPILFNTVQEMRTAILGGKISESQLVTMQKYFSKNTTGEVRLFDLNNMSDIALPEGAKLESVRFMGSNYTFSFRADGFSGSLSIVTKEQMQEYDDDYNMEKTKLDVVNIEENTEHNAKVYYVKNDEGIWKHTQYSYSNKNGYIIIHEVDPPEENLDSALCLCIDYWGEYNGTCFYGFIVDPTERPSPEWFQEFGLKPYVETKTP